MKKDTINQSVAWGRINTILTGQMFLMLVIILLCFFSVSATATYPDISYNSSASRFFSWIIIGGTQWFIFFILRLLIAGFIYDDACKKGKSGEAVIWAIIGFFFHIIALIIWILVRPGKTSRRRRRKRKKSKRK